MKTNLLSNMQTLAFVDRDGNAAQVLVKVFSQNDHYHVFLTDRYRPGLAAVARNGACYANQLLHAMDLTPAEVNFYRHVYHAHTGSLFGGFSFDWDDQGVCGYTFAMITRPEDIKTIAQLTRLAKLVDVSHLTPATAIPEPAEEKTPSVVASVSLL